MTQFLSIRCGLAAIRSRGLRAALVALVTATLAVATTAHAVTIDWVTVGDPGNAADTTGYGAVADSYKIGKYIVTISQYTAFLNAVARSDPYSLYNPNMGTNLNIAGISRSGLSGSYTYSMTGPSGITPAGASSAGNRPITYVSWFDAARFANWMHNGQGSGSTETGAYTLVGGQTSGTPPARNAGAQFYIPTENEWYKAAYYSPVLNSGSGGYYTYATQSNADPGNVIGSGANMANYNNGFTKSVTQSAYTLASQNYLTEVGAFANAASFYGTFDQSGNVYQWSDQVGASSTTIRVRRGGAWNANAFGMSRSWRFTGNASTELDNVGFRLASPASGSAGVPEIDAEGARLVAGLIVCGLALLERRRHGS